MDLISFALALLPIVWLVVALAGLKIQGHIACLIALAGAFVLSVSWWQQSPLCSLSAALEGLLNALWPICLVVVAALFMYNLLVHTGAMGKIKQMLGGISKDKRMLALLIGWGFGTFMEGMAGFGTAVAIPASMLVGVGFAPLPAVVACLVVNAIPTGFGSVGVPTMTLSSVTGLDISSICIDIALQGALIMFISPYFLVAICGGGVKALKGMTGVTTLASLAYLAPWMVMAIFAGPQLPDVAGAICTMAVILLCAKLRGNKEIDPDYLLDSSQAQDQDNKLPVISAVEGVKAWLPFIFAFVLLFASSPLVAPVHEALAALKSSATVYLGDNPNTLSFSWVNTPGVMLFIAAFIGGLFQGAKVSDMGRVLVQTLKSYWKALTTICAVMAMAKIMGYAGMIGDIAAVLVVVAGPLYPVVAPIIATIGGFVTGSGTSTNVLFGGLQTETAAGLGLSQSWIAAGNAVGGGIGKILSPQSMAIGASATGLVGQESQILKETFKCSVVYLVIACICCMTGTLFF